MFRDLLVTRGAEFAGRPDMHEGNWFSYGGQDIAFGQPTNIWRTLRKLGHASIRMYDKGLQRIETISMEMVNEMLDKFAEKNGQPFDPKPHLSLATMNIVALLLVGRSYREGSEFFKAFLTFEKTTWDVLSRRLAGAIMDKLPWLRPYFDLLSGPGKRQQAATQALYKLVKVETKKSEDEGFNEGIGSLLRRAVEKGDITDLNASLACANIILGGSATTTNTMHAFLNIMIHHPQIQRRLQKEVDDVIGQRQVTLDDRPDMPYHYATLLELLRYTAVAPLGIPHMAIKDTTIAGKRVPEGTAIFFNFYALQHDEKCFPEPFKFKPERFIDGEGKLVPADHPNRRNMFSFSTGPRVCFGEALAKSRLFLIIACIMQKFDVRGDESRDLVSYDARDYICRGLLVQSTYNVCLIQRP